MVESRPGRAYLPVRAVHRPDGGPVADALERAISAIEGVHWASVNPVLAEVAIAFEDGSVDIDDLVDVVEAVEREHGVHDEALPQDLPEHPADEAPLQRTLVELAADGIGVGVGMVGSVLRLPGVPVQVANALPGLVSIGPLRSVIEARPGFELATVAASSVLQGFGHQPLGLLVDAAHRGAVLAELASRRRAWLALEHRLHPGPPAHRPPAVDLEPRPQPLPPGLAERYAQVASLTALGGAGIGLAASRDPRRAADMLLAGLPRPVRLGTEGFAAQLGRGLSGRQVVPMEPRVLRRLDRVDTVVLDAELAVTGRLAIGEVVPAAPGEPASLDAAHAVLRSLFDPSDPDAVRDAVHEGCTWALGPATLVDARWPRGAKTRARADAVGASRLLALCRAGLVVAVVTLRPEVHEAAAQVAASARSAGCQLVVGGVRSGAAEPLGADRAVPGGQRLARSIRQLQAEGRVVALVSARAGAAQRAADCGIGVLDAGADHPPWGADLLCAHLALAATVIDGIGLARVAARQVAACAAIGSSSATLLALGPLPGASRRAATATQLASIAALAGGAWTAAQLPRRRPAVVGERTDWHALDAEEVLGRLGSGPGGLSAEEARRRSAPPDEGARAGLLQLIVGELANPLSLILGGGAALSALTGSGIDAALIGAALGADALVGAAQRLRTEAAIGRLATAIAEGTVRVLREGPEVVTSRTALVPGDVVRLAAGDAVPADCRLVDATALEVDESSLTGESLPVVKDPVPVAPRTALADRRSMVYEGTAVAAGRATAVVVATGGATAAHRGDAEVVPPVTGVQSRLRTLMSTTVPLVLASGAGLTLNGLLRGRPPREAVASGVSLATAAVPEGLPFVATVAQAGAAHRLARRGVLVRNPGVLEALGRVDVLCIDKTGTLTEGRLRLQVVSDGETEEAPTGLSGERRDVLAAALRATPRPRGHVLPHPTDQAVVDGAAAAGIRHAHGAAGWRKAGSLPFVSDRGYHAVVGVARAGPLLSVKGAPEVVLPRCTTVQGATGHPAALDDAAVTDADATVERLARRGFRVLVVAERPVSSIGDLDDERVAGLTLLGFIGVADEARASAAAPLDQLWRAGINCVMVTGDHPSTAEAVATDLGLLNGRGVVTGAQLDEMDDTELRRVVAETAVFARVSPADKVRIVSAFQHVGRVVAMTGDGANDAQAIRLAEIGMAFGPRATSAARDAADLVVAPEDLGVLIDTIVEGRAMWASVRDALAILLGGNLGEVVFTVGAAVLTGQSPLVARQLLVVNLFTDLVPAMALAARAPSAGHIRLEREGPETSLGSQLAREVVIRAAATAASAYGAWFAARLTGTPTRARTVALAALVGSQLGQTAIVGRRSPLVVGTSLVSAAGLVAIIQTPGVSRFFGCRPLGPLGWSIAGTAAALSSVGAGVAGAVLR